MRKLHYSIDNFNRLVLKDKDRTYPVYGEFKIEKNELVFIPSSKYGLPKDLDLPRRIVLKGKWKLNEEHNLVLWLEENDYQYKEDKLEIRGKIFSVESDVLIFQANFKKTPYSERISLLHLEGRWQADIFNRLVFLVHKEDGEDTLKFISSWQVNENQQIVYIYNKELKGIKSTEYLEFRGFWELDKENQISYILDFKNNSFFQFKGTWNISKVQGERGEIVCKVGIKLAKKIKENNFSLFGEWRIKKNSLLFEIDYGEGRREAIVFKTEINLDKDKNLIFVLKNKRNQRLGIEIIFEKSFLKKNARFFLHFSKEEKERLIESGIKIFW